MTSRRIEGRQEQYPAIVRFANITAGTIGEVCSNAVTQASSEEEVQAIQSLHGTLVEALSERLVAYAPYLQKDRFAHAARIK